VVLENRVGVGAVPEIYRNVRQGGSDQGMNVWVVHECMGIGLGAKYQSIETVKQSDGLGANLVTAIQQSPGISFGGSRWPEASL
jgi:hypothetical protein